MGSIFPRNGVSPAETDNAYLPALAPLNDCAVKYYPTSGCAVRFDPKAMNAYLSLFARALDMVGLPYDCLNQDLLYNLVCSIAQDCVNAGIAGTTDFIPSLIAADIRSSGVDSGDFLTGARRQRPLNTLVRNTIGATLSSNRITLPAGTYWFRWLALARGVARHQSYLYDVTHAVDLGYSLPGVSEPFSASANPGTQDSRSILIGPIVLAGSTAIEVQHECTISRLVDGMGSDVGFGQPVTYCVVEAWKTA